MQTTERPVILQLMEAMQSGDRQGAAQLVHEDVVMEWPQSGERFVGRENALAAIAATEEKPEPAGEPKVAGSGDLWVLRMPLRYGEEIYHYVGIFELADGRVRHTTEYFGAPFPANPARAQFADRTPAGA